MSSPWDPAITQAMQRHGGSNRSVPKTAQATLVPKERPDDAADTAPPRRRDEDRKPAVKPERS